MLDAAMRLLNDRPDTSVEAIAEAAGVTRPTVYAHFPTRERLLAAVVDRITEESVAAMDAADLDEGPAADALVRLLEASNRTAGRYPGLVRLIASLPLSPEAGHELHSPVAARLERVVERGQRSGEFDRQLPAHWLVAATIALGHAAHAEVEAGRIPRAEAEKALRRSLLRILGAERHTPKRRR